MIQKTRLCHKVFVDHAMIALFIEGFAMLELAVHVDEISRICFAQVDWNYPAEDRLYRAIRLCEGRLGEVQEQYLKMMQGNSGNEDEAVNSRMQFTDFFAADLRHVSLLHCVFDLAPHATENLCALCTRMPSFHAPHVVSKHTLPITFPLQAASQVPHSLVAASTSSTHHSTSISPSIVAVRSGSTETAQMDT